MATPVTNFGKVTVSTGYNAAATSIVLSTGHGSRLPATFPYPLTWWEATTYSDPADDPNREIVIVTNRSGDTLTVTRAGEGTTASVKNTAGKTYKMLGGITQAMWDDIATENSLSQSFRGLAVQTHPDNDKAAAQVTFSADSIVMNDGQEVLGWSNVAVNLAASGVNGLDTGTEVANAWYELWAIFDGTNKKGLLHRAKDYFLDESWDQSGGTTEDGQHALRDATARTKLAQGFKVDTAGPVPFIDVKLVKVGAPTGNYWFTIEANSGGVPSNTPLATSDKYDISRVPVASTWVRLPFRTPATLSAATQYHLVLQGDFTVSASNYLAWRADTTASTYANGAKAAYDGTTWTADTDDDCLFKIYVTRNDVAITMPAGYTQLTKIAYCYNNASSNLKHFWQQDRQVFCGYDDDWQVGALANTSADLVSLQSFVPPVSAVVEFVRFNGTSVGASVGQLSATDIAPSFNTEKVGSVRSFIPANVEQLFPLIAIDSYQGVMYVVGGSVDSLYVSSFAW